MRWGYVLVVVSGLLAARPASAGETVIPLSGDVPDDRLDHFRVPFDVPAGTAEVEVRHDDLSEDNILDWGLEDPNGVRGWGGGNSEPAIVGEDAASRSYTPGPIPAGTWNVIVGKAQIEDPPGQYEIEVVLRTTATLEAQPERAPYEPAAALSEEARWYAGDVHVHSVESGDARPPLDEIGMFARMRGLDFVVLSDHNVHTALDFLGDVQPRHPELLFVPGVEFTTYDGHANGLGATQFVDHKIGQKGVTVEAAVEAYHDQGALFAINHPELDLGPLCIGCAWGHDLDPALIDAVEVATGGLEPFGAQYTEAAIAFWDSLCDMGYHVVPIGGSDDHKAGVDLNQFQSPIGSGTTMVYAERLDAESILAGIRSGRTVIKLQDPDDPMIELGADATIEGDTIASNDVTLTATISAGNGHQVRLVRNGEVADTQMIAGDPADFEWPVSAPAEGQDRYRVEVVVDGRRRVLTSHLWIEAGEEQGTDTTGTTTGSPPTTTTGGTTTGPAATGTDTDPPAAGDPPRGCGCRTTSRHTLPLLLIPLLGRRRSC